MEENKELVKDPVCGMVKPVSQMVASSVFNGKTYYFCSNMDKEMFDKHPDRWIGGDKQA